MKIIICVKRDLEGCIALNYLLKKNKPHDYHVILSDKFTKTEREIKQSADFIFFERDLLVRQIFPLLERSPQEKSSSYYRTFNQIKKEWHIPVEICDNINSVKWEARIKKIHPDAILSIRNDFIFKNNIIPIPRLGVYNIHPGSLPEYRGVYAPFRAMFNKDKKAGCTLHRIIDEGIDTGPIIGIKTMTIDYSRSVLWHMCQLYPLGIDLFFDILPKLEKNEKIQMTLQDESRHHYYTFPTAEEFSIFSNRGNTLIDHQEYLEILDRFSSP